MMKKHWALLYHVCTYDIKEGPAIKNVYVNFSKKILSSTTFTKSFSNRRKIYRHARVTELM